MDEMKIVSKFTTNMISKLVKKVLRKKTGYMCAFKTHAKGARFDLSTV